MAATNGLSVVEPEILRRAVNAIRAGAEHRQLYVFAAFFLGVALVAGLFRYLMRMTLIGVSRQVEYDLREDLFSHLMDLSLSYYRRVRTGDIMARATNDLEAVRGLIGPGLMYGASTMLLVPVVLVLMARRDLLITVLAVAPFPLLTFGIYQLGKAVHQRFRDVQVGYAKLTTRVQENLSGIRVVKAGAREEREVSEFHETNADYLEKNLRMVRLRGAYGPMMAVATGVSSMVVLGLGGQKVGQGVMTLGDLVAFMAYLMMLAWPMMALGWVLGLYQRGLAALERLGEVMDERPEIADAAETASGDPVRGDLVFDNVSLSFGGTPVLREVSLRVPAGTTTAVVGRTGSGKTTLLTLVPRLVDVTEGRVLLDGIDLRLWPVAELRRAIGYVPQETFLFSTTLRENVAFSGDGVEEMVFQEAVETSRLARDMDQFPMGFETLVGERGVTLSGGERQRTALARALARRPAILLLDDVFASVDPGTEGEILAGLRAARAGRTCLVVSHRLHSIRDVDQIVVLDEGRVVETGTFDELKAKGGLFAELHRRQELLLELERE